MIWGHRVESYLGLALQGCLPDEEEGWGERQGGWTDGEDRGGEEMKKQGNILRTWPRSRGVKKKGKCLVPRRLSSGSWVIRI